MRGRNLGIALAALAVVTAAAGPLELRPSPSGDPADASHHEIERSSVR
jgi:hypothetical protein